MIDTQTRRMRNLAHDRASELWADAKIVSPIGGLAERVRGNDLPKTAEAKARERIRFAERNAQSINRATRRYPWPAPSGQAYLPHSGKREAARRLRQAAKIIIDRTHFFDIGGHAVTVTTRRA